MFTFQRLLIDRYVFFMYVKVLAISFGSLAGLFVIIDIMNNLQELSEYGKSQSGGFARVIAEYYGPRVLMLFDQIAGMQAMVAGMMTVTLLQANHELTALMAAGISRIRIAAPLLVGAIIVCVLGVINREVVLPSVSDRLSYNAQDLSGQMGRVLHQRYDQHTRIIFGGAKTFPKQKRIRSPKFMLPPYLSGWGKKIEGDEAYYLPANADHPAGYMVKNVKAPADITERPSVMLEDSLLLFSPHDQKWLAADECFVASDLTFEQLTGNTSFRSFLATSDLIAGLQNKSLDYGNDVKVVVHTRFLRPVVDIVILFLGLPLVITRQARSIFVTAGFCAGIVVLFLVVSLACQAAGANYLLWPALAAWLPIVIFAPVAVVIGRPLWE